MSGIMFMILAVLAMTFSPCVCQYGGGEMGGMGGMGAMGAMGGMGTMSEMMGGMAGMGGLNAMMGGGGGFGAMMGGGGMGSMMGGGGGGGIGASIGAMVRQGAMANAINMVNQAVHYIVGPNAAPDQTLLAFVNAQTAPPSTFMQWMTYLPHMQRIARTFYGPWLAETAAKSPPKKPIASNTVATAATNATATATTGLGGKTLAQLQADLDTVVMQRAMEYIRMRQNSPNMQGANPGMMQAITAMIPQMVQGISAAYM